MSEHKGRRLREYVGAVEWDNADEQRIYRVNNGVVEVRKKGVSKWSQAAMIYAEDIAGVADLLANPDEPQPVETLEGVLDAVVALANEGNWEKRSRDAADLCARLRAAFPHLDAPHPPTDAKTVGAALADSAEESPRGDLTGLPGWWNVYGDRAVRHESRGLAKACAEEFHALHTAVRIAVVPEVAS
jgi:hypothetical protein